MIKAYDPEKYGKLLITASPGAIKTEEENEKALAVVLRLMKKGERGRSPEENRLLELLVTLIENFEEKAYPMGGSNPAVALRELMSEHGLKQNRRARHLRLPRHRLPSPQRQTRNQQIPSPQTLETVSAAHGCFHLGCY